MGQETGIDSLMDLLALENGAFIAKLMLVQAGITPHGDQGYEYDPGDQYEITRAEITAQETIVVNHGYEIHLTCKRAK